MHLHILTVIFFPWVVLRCYRKIQWLFVFLIIMIKDNTAINSSWNLVPHFRHTYPIMLTSFWSRSESPLSWVSLLMLSWLAWCLELTFRVNLGEDQNSRGARSSEWGGWRHTVVFLGACLSVMVLCSTIHNVFQHALQRPSQRGLPDMLQKASRSMGYVCLTTGSVFFMVRFLN